MQSSSFSSCPQWSETELPHWTSKLWVTLELLEPYWLEVNGHTGLILANKQYATEAQPALHGWWWMASNWFADDTWYSNIADYCMPSLSQIFQVMYCQFDRPEILPRATFPLWSVCILDRLWKQSRQHGRGTSKKLFVWEMLVANVTLVWNTEIFHDISLQVKAAAKKHFAYHFAIQALCTSCIALCKCKDCKALLERKNPRLSKISGRVLQLERCTGRLQNQTTVRTPQKR